MCHYRTHPNLLRVHHTTIYYNNKIIRDRSPPPHTFYFKRFKGIRYIATNGMINENTNNVNR